MNRKGLLLVLLMLLAAALLYAWLASPRLQRHATADHGGSGVSRDLTDRSARSAELRVRLDLLEQKPAAYPGVKRNLFGPLYEAPPPPPKPVVRDVPVQPPPPPPPPQIEVVRRELARFTFMGYLRKEGSWTIFLQSEGEIFLVKEGDRFGRDNAFFARSITPEKLTLTQQGLSSPIEIPLVEQKPLVPSFMQAVPQEVDEAAASDFEAPAVETSPFAPTGRLSPLRQDARRMFGVGRGAPLPPPPSLGVGEPDGVAGTPNETQPEEEVRND